jgi:hypothetical protein
MEKPFVETLSTFELNQLREQAAQGGDYEAARGLLEREYHRRTLAIQAIGTVDMPYLVPENPADLNICESCE